MAKAQSPSEVRIQIRNDSFKPATDSISIHRKHDTKVRANIRSQQAEGQAKGGPVRMWVEWSPSKDFDGKAGGRKASGWGGTRKNVTLGLNNLTENTRYYVRVRVEQRGRDQLSNASTFDFYTERQPFPPRLDEPSENSTVNEGGNIRFQWTHQDADTDPDDDQSEAEFRWRRSATLTRKAGEWRTEHIAGTDHVHFLETVDMGGNRHYDWEVRTKDTHSTWWSQWSSRSFYLRGDTTPPRIVAPIDNHATSTDDGVLLEWQFRDPDADERQVQADVRYRVVGVEEWTTRAGGTEPGGVQEWFQEPGVILPGYRYEWQVRTYNDAGAGPGITSAWSNSGFFHAIRRPGWAVSQDDGPVPVSFPQGSLGEGVYRIHAYDQGGERYRGEISGMQQLTWGRLRDDISTCSFTTSGFPEDCGRMIGELRTWAHEIVLFRNGERVWEGPITRIGDHGTFMEIEARDPMAYVYRRIMRQGYNDNFRRPKQGIVGKKTVVQRAAIIIQNALAPYDPNVLPYFTVMDYPDDAMQSRSVADWSKTAWQEIDDLAATAGLDYTTVGRRIIIHDTHRGLGLLAEMRNVHFFNPPVITEYGMNAANIFGVTSTTGVYGAYEFPQDKWYGSGPIEQLASAYGESADAPADPRVLTRQQKADLEHVLDLQAARNINGRWATVHIDHQGTADDADDLAVAGRVYGAPVVVRVPDNSQVHPDAPVGIQQLIPGVHIPLRAQGMTRAFAQVQKLDALHVTVEGGIERVQVTMSPAPLHGLDPDQGGGGDEA